MDNDAEKNEMAVNGQEADVLCVPQTENAEQIEVSDNQNDEAGDVRQFDVQEPNDNKGKKEKPKKNMVQEIASWVFVLSVAVIIALLIRSFIFIIVQVDGPSMMGTLHTENRLFVWRAGYIFNEPERQDIIICHYPRDVGSHKASDNYVKRLIGLPGDTISIIDGYVYINGSALDEPYIEENRRKKENMSAVTLKEDEYFVMGDNRVNSTDSRMVGPIKRSDVLGKAVFKIYPFNEIGEIKTPEDG